MTADLALVHDDDEPPPTRLQRAFPWMRPDSDDPDILVRYLYGQQTNTDTGYVSHEIVLTLAPRSWTVGVQAEHVDTGYDRARPGYYRHITVSLGPWHLTASRQRGTL